MSRRYVVRLSADGGTVTITAARAVVEHGALAFYATRPNDERETLTAAFGPGGWEFMQVENDG